MYRKRFSLLVAAAVCVALALPGSPRPAQAEQLETVSMEFAMYFPCSPEWMIPPPVLSDFVGEDTVLILFEFLEDWLHYLRFSPFSPPCGDVEVADTWWRLHAYADIIKIGGPIELAYIYTRSSPAPPAPYPLLFDKITDVQSCWVYETFTSQDWVTQEDWDARTIGAFLIVTAEFRVKQ